MYQAIKRFTDILIALFVILLLIPLFIIIIPLLKFTAEGEIFYLQERIGFKNKPFNIIKFATMLKNSPNMGTGMITLRGDPRVTSIGKFLRISKLNELPQVFNVLYGDMSLVGPRPLVKKNFDEYPNHVKYEINKVKPGITGIGSIVFRDEEELLSNSSVPPHEYYRNVIAPYKGSLELWYQKNASTFTDFKIILLTAWSVFFKNSKLHYKVFDDLPKPINSDLELVKGDKKENSDY